MNTLKNWLQTKATILSGHLEKSLMKNKSLKCKVVFGPIRSRRLGYILGINNIKPGICSYDCVYCPSGSKSICTICRTKCLSPYELYVAVKHKIAEIKKSGKDIDYIAFMGSGEPAIDSDLPNEIMILREFGYKIAVFTNSSLIWNENVQENLRFADIVSVKIDTVNQDTWIKLNRPHRRLKYDTILEGIKRFSKYYKGHLITETMFVNNINDSEEEIEGLAKYLNTLKREISYFMYPIFPPGTEYAVCPNTEKTDKIKVLIKKLVKYPILLCCPEKEEFVATDDFENELLGLVSIHPVRTEAVLQYIKNEKDNLILKEMIEKHVIKEVEFQGKRYYAENAAS